MSSFLISFFLGMIIAFVLTVSFCRFYYRRKKLSSAVPKTSELEELGRITGGLAHEIKNPLSIIKVNLKLISESLIGEDANTARAARKIAAVRKETDRLEQILEDFLRYIKKAELNLSSVDINKIVADMVDFYSPQAQSHSITIRSQLWSQSLVCKADGDMLKQVLLNLFINAQQAMPDGGEVFLRTQADGKNAVIIISDTGKGIEPKNMEKIFNAYFSTKPGGSGLGLSTSKKIIEAHNGSIRVDSVLGRGTSFTIQLPLED
jgi:two-component system sensor histidine kinase HydH